MAPFALEMASSACSPGLGPKRPEQPARRRVEKITTQNARRFIMWCMSEGSLPPFGIPGPRSVPGALKRVLGRFLGRPRPAAQEPAPDAAVVSRAGVAIGRHAGEHATLFERAERLAVKAGRLDEAGTPREAASNRAARAREEVEAGLAALRDAFVASEGKEGAHAFDREVGRRFPVL